MKSANHWAGGTQAGFSLLELAIVLVIVSLLSWSVLAAYQNVSEHRQRVHAQGAAAHMQAALRAFALRHKRLPCPDVAGQGYEAGAAGGGCATASQFGWFPYTSVGLAMPKPALRARYAVFRQSGQAAHLDADLAVAKERSGDSLGAVNYQAVSDLIVALNNASRASPAGHPFLTGDGQSGGAIDCVANVQQVVAYWLVLPLADRKGDGDLFDASYQPDSLCVVSPAAPRRWDFDDVVFAESPVQLAGWLRMNLP